MKNQQVAAIFRHLAAFLEMRGEGLFRIRAYRRAAQVIEQINEDVEAIARRNGLRDLPGIGKDLAGKIQEILNTGTLALYEQIKSEIPPVLLAFLAIPGLGARTAHYLYDRLGIRTLEDLETMVRTHMLRTLPEIDKEVEDQILRSIQQMREGDAGRRLPN